MIKEAPRMSKKTPVTTTIVRAYRPFKKSQAAYIYARELVGRTGLRRCSDCTEQPYLPAYLEYIGFFAAERNDHMREPYSRVGHS
jgi:hypothetical protein